MTISKAIHSIVNSMLKKIIRIILAAKTVKTMIKDIKLCFNSSSLFNRDNCINRKILGLLTILESCSISIQEGEMLNSGRILHLLKSENIWTGIGS